MLRMPRRRTVTLAIVDGAQVRSALHNLAADARAGRRIVIALRERRAARIGDRAAGRLGLRRLRCRIPVARPFPDIADHVEKPVAIGRKAADRRGAVIAVGLGRRNGKQRSEEHTSELQSLMRISYAGFCLKKKKHEKKNYKKRTY